MNPILWAPTTEQIERTHLWRFMQQLGFSAYDRLWEWSVTERGPFWQAVWEFGGVTASRPAERPLGTERMPGTEWFPGARLNFAENLLRRSDDAPAIVTAAEGRDTETTSWAELNTRVAGVQAGLGALGVGAGDRVAALIPNCAEAIIGMLGAASLGAVWSSCSPDFGPTGVVDRFGQIEPKVLIVADGYTYNGKVHRLQDTVRAVVARIPAVETVVVVDFAGVGLDAGETPVMDWSRLQGDGAERPEFTPLPFDHPLYIMYSSGTTGPPKSIVHGAGGTLLKHLCEHLLHGDVHHDDRVFWFTTCGWMMWNWLVSALAAEAAVVTFDGSPSHPTLETLWRLAEEARITHFGGSPRLLAATAKAGVVPGEVADLGRLRWLGSTGAPLNPEQFDWVYSNVKADLQLASITGGTDIIGLFAGGVPILPVRRGEIQARTLGTAVQAFDDAGEPVIGRRGELVCTAPFPSMPIEFWRDPGGRRYREAYFEAYKGVWTHGDFIEIRPEGGVIVYGRSDTTLNPGGVRIGTAEIYRVVETMPEIADSIVVGRDVEGDQEIVLFVKTAPGIELDQDLVARIKAVIRAETTPRHVPHHVLSVDDIPYTISGKKVEKAVRKVLSGEPVLNRDAIANPESLDLFAGRL